MQAAWVLACLDSDDQCVLHSWSPMTRSFPDLMRTTRHEPFPKSLLATSKVYVYIYIYIYIYIHICDYCTRTTPIFKDE